MPILPRILFDFPESFFDFPESFLPSFQVSSSLRRTHWADAARTGTWQTERHIRPQRSALSDSAPPPDGDRGCFPAPCAPWEKIYYLVRRRAARAIVVHPVVFRHTDVTVMGPPRRRTQRHTPRSPRFEIRMPSQPSPQPTRLGASETQESRNTQRALRALELPRRSFRPNYICSAQRSTTTQPGNAQCLKCSQTLHMPTPLHVADPHEVPGLTMCQPEGADQCCASTALIAALSQPRGTAAGR